MNFDANENGSGQDNNDAATAAQTDAHAPASAGERPKAPRNPRIETLAAAARRHADKLNASIAACKAAGLDVQYEIDADGVFLVNEIRVSKSL